MTHLIHVENIYSDKSAEAISRSLNAHKGVKSAVVNVTNGIVIVETEENDYFEISELLKELGYPEYKSI